MNLTKTLDLDRTEKFDHEFNGEKYSFSVKMNAFTPEFHGLYKDADTDPRAIAKALSIVLVNWDVELEEGQPFPPTFENLLKVPSDFLWDLLVRIFDTWQGDEADKKKISKYIGSMGRYGSLPFYYHIHEAAEVLQCSFMELESHPERSRLMRIAFTIKHGKSDGERMLKKNPEFKRLVQAEVEAEK